MPKQKDGMHEEKKLAKGMEISKGEAIKENKKLAKLRKKTIVETNQEFVKKVQNAMKDPNILVNTLREIQKEVAGEEDTIIAEIIVATTRLVKGAIPESTNLFLSDKTGIGKDYTTKKTLEVIVSKEDNLHITKMSNEAFTYWNADDPNWDWSYKVIHLEDITQALLNCPTFKVMASGESKAVVVRDQKTKEISIKGKPCMIITSHHANPQDEALRRFPIGALNDTIDQTKRVKDRVSRKYTCREQTEKDIILRSAVQSLEPYSVVIPYAELIQYFFPEDILMRTHFHRFLNYICSSAVFHQEQREKTEDGKLIATPDDYMIARLVLIYTTSNPKMIPMSKEYRDVLKILQENVDPMSVSEIFLRYDKSKDWLYKHLPNLVETNLVIRGNKHDEKANKFIDTYQYSPGENPNAIPTWHELQQKIEKIINKTNKTKKTNEENILERWFSDNEIRPIKPKNSEGFYLVFLGHRIPFNRKVFLVFGVLRQYLRERDEKRYRRYYEEKDLDLHEKLNHLRNIVETNRKSGRKIDEGFLSYNFDHNFISQCIESGLLIKQGNGEYVFGG